MEDDPTDLGPLNLSEGNNKENEISDATVTFPVNHSTVGDDDPLNNTSLVSFVFEISPRANKSANKDAISSPDGRERSPLARLVWVYPAVTPETSLAQALDCSMLVINSPSLDSVCSRRLFSRIGS